MIEYKKRRKYKYTLHSDYPYKTDIEVTKTENSGLLEIQSDGNLIIKAGYSWNGPSGPSIDTKTFMQGSLVHDALYQLMREKNIQQNQRKKADEILQKICKKDNMCSFRAWYVYLTVRLFGGSSARPDVLIAP